MPILIEGHEYLLMVSSFTEGIDGYVLFFEGGTAVINNPSEPHLKTVKQDCYDKVTVKLTKKVLCSSLTPTGSEFSLSPAGAGIVAAVASNCSISPYFDEMTLTLSNTLPNGDYNLVVNKRQRRQFPRG